MRFARLAPIVAALAVGAAGCGSSGERTATEGPQTGATAQPPSTITTPAGVVAQSCASEGADEVRVSGVDCDTGRAVATGWAHKPGCASPAGASRFACTVRGYRCLGAATDRGFAVACALPNRSIAFVVKRG